MISSLGTFHYSDDPGVHEALQEIVGPANQIKRRLGGLNNQIDFDSHLLRHSGRWDPGSIEPTEYFPGDVPIIRSIIAGASSRSTQRALSHPEARGLLDNEAEQTFLQTLAVDALALYRSRPFFVPSDLALAIAESEPPSEELLAEIRLPFESVWVNFGRDLALPEEMTWPPDVQSRDGDSNPLGFLPFNKGVGDWKHNILEALFNRGGAITGLVLFSGPDGKGLADHLVWIVSANPDPTMPALYRNDAQRGGLLALRSQSLLSPIIKNFAVAVAGSQWYQARDDAPTIGERGTERWFRSLDRDRARRALRAGAFSGVHIIDLEATRAMKPGQEEISDEARIGEHVRRGHPHRYRIAKRDEAGNIIGTVQGEKDVDWRYEVRWIPLTVINPGVTTRADVQVWRLPNPETLRTGPVLTPRACDPTDC